MTIVPPPLRSILVALDESERAPLVLAAAAMLAQKLDAELLVIRVLVVAPEIPPAAHAHPNGLEAFLAHDARTSLEALMNSYPQVDFGPPIVIIAEEPWRHIVDTARSLDVDLVVVGTRRHHGRLDRMLGTIAAKVVNHADRSVLVVHERGVDRDRTA